MEKLILTVFVVAIAVGVLAPTRAPTPAAPQSAVKMALPEPKPVTTPAGNGIAEAELTRAPDGHFYAAALVNGQPIRFIVDTGATTVALTKRDAEALGIHSSAADFTGVGEGAAGKIAYRPVRLDWLAVGPLDARGVDAVVVNGDMRVSLLGQSWLKRVGTVTIEGDKMVLR